MLEEHTKYFVVKSSDLCIKNKTRDQKNELLKLKDYLTRIDPYNLDSFDLDQIKKIVLVQLNGGLSEFFTKYPVVLETDYLYGKGLFIRENGLIIPIEIDKIGELYGHFSFDQTDKLRDLICDFSKQGEESMHYYKMQHDQVSTNKEKAKILIARYKNGINR